MILIEATLATMSRDSIKLGEIDLNVENILSLLEDKSVGVPSWLPLLLGQKNTIKAIRGQRFV